MVGATGFEPATTCTPRHVKPPSPLSTRCPSTLQRRGLPVVPLRAPEDVLTVRDIAAILKVVPATVYAMIELGQLAHFRANNAIRVRLSGKVHAG